MWNTKWLLLTIFYTSVYYLVMYGTKSVTEIWKSRMGWRFSEETETDSFSCWELDPGPEAAVDESVCTEEYCV